MEQRHPEGNRSREWRPDARDTRGYLAGSEPSTLFRFCPPDTEEAQSTTLIDQESKERQIRKSRWTVVGQSISSMAVALVSGYGHPGTIPRSARVAFSVNCSHCRVRAAKFPITPFFRWTDCYAGEIGILDALPATIKKNAWKSEHDAGFDPIRQVAIMLV
jgi:hypothetical protein